MMNVSESMLTYRTEVKEVTLVAGRWSQTVKSENDCLAFMIRNANIYIGKTYMVVQFSFEGRKNSSNDIHCHVYYDCGVCTLKTK